MFTFTWPFFCRDVIPYRCISYGLCIFLTIGVFAVAIYISFAYSSVGSSPDSSGIWYSPNVSHLVPVSGVFCQSLHVSTDSNTDGFNISLFMLSTAPTLTDRDYFTFSEVVTFGNEDLIEYYYYLYEGSTINISSCLVENDGSRIFFYLIKSNKTYQRTKQKLPNINTFFAEVEFEVDGHCNGGLANSIIYNVSKSDFYYLLFVDRKSTWTSNSLNVSLSLNRTKYALGTHASDYCESDSSIPGPVEWCAVSVPLSGHTALLNLEPTEYNNVVDWAGYKAFLTTKCSPRVWMYTLLSLSVTFGIILVLILFFVICIAATKCHKRRVHHPALLEHMSPVDSSSSDIQSDLESLQSAKFSPKK